MTMSEGELDRMFPCLKNVEEGIKSAILSTKPEIMAMARATLLSPDEVAKGLLDITLSVLKKRKEK